MCRKLNFLSRHFHRHQWTTFSKVLQARVNGKSCSSDRTIPVKRECQKCGKKQINVWGYWFTVKNLRDLALYEVL